MGIFSFGRKFCHAVGDDIGHHTPGISAAYIKPAKITLSPSNPVRILREFFIKRKVKKIELFDFFSNDDNATIKSTDTATEVARDKLYDISTFVVIDDGHIISFYIFSDFDDFVFLLCIAAIGIFGIEGDTILLFCERECFENRGKVPRLLRSERCRVSNDCDRITLFILRESCPHEVDSS